ncbi:Ankyrin repeat-containing domain protein [Lactarius tabidus]
MALRDAGLGLTAYYYFDFRAKAKQDLRGFLSSLVVQLCAKSDSCYQILLRLYSVHDNGSQLPDDDALVQCLKDMLELPEQPTIYLIVDALDECPSTCGVVSPRDWVLEFIEDLVESHLPNLRICASSRPEADISEALGPLASHTVSLHDEAGQKQDIVDYVTFVVHSDRKMRKWRAEDKKLVINTISERADGMFRWVFCQLETLRGCYPQGLRRALDKLPETLDATYERTFLGIEKTKREYAYRLFQCLVVSIRPLRVEELAEVLAVLLDTGEDSEYHADWCPEDAQQEVLSTCSSLIAITNVDGSSVVQFSHFSVKEFLMSSRLANAGEPLSRYHILPNSSHSVIARACLCVLLSLGDQVDKNVVENHPFALYASRYWVDHANCERVLSSIGDLVESLFDLDQPHFATWVWLYDVDRPWQGHMATTRPMKPNATPLYYASLCGFRNIVKYLATTHPGDVDASGGCHCTALHAAITKREVDTVLELLQQGADKYVLDRFDQSPLHNASRYGYLDLVEVLLEAGVEVNLRNSGDETPLDVSLYSGNDDVAHFLIERGANVHRRDERGQTPLHKAARYGHLRIVQFLLDLDIGVGFQNRDQDTPLSLASTGDHVEACVEASRPLIEHQSDVASADDKGWTPLHFASRHGHADVVRLLLDNGADVNVQQINLWAPLHLASRHGHLKVAELLIERGAEVDVLDQDQHASLSLASGNGELDVVRLLIKCGSNVNSRDTQGWTSLHSAARNGHLDVVKLLLDSGADIGMRDMSDKAPFDIALDNGRHDVVNILTHHGGNPSTRFGESVRSTSLEAESQNNIPTISFLEPQRPTSDADEETNDEHSTSLHSAMENKSVGTIKRLLDRGADANERDKHFQTPLLVASIGRAHKRVRFLQLRL